MRYTKSEAFWEKLLKISVEGEDYTENCQYQHT